AGRGLAGLAELRCDWDMRYTVLGRNGLEVSRIAFRSWQLGGEWGSFDEKAAMDAIRHARELWVNFFDTAQAYGFGKSEQILGNALREELRSEEHTSELQSRENLVCRLLLE